MSVKGGLYYAKDYLRVIRRCRRIPIGIRTTGSGLGDYMVLTVGTRCKDTMGTQLLCAALWRQSRPE